MKMKGIKRFVAISVALVMLVCLLTACTAKDAGPAYTEDNPPSDGTEISLIEDNPLFEVFVTALPGVEKTEKTIFTVDNPSRVTDIILMFNGWKPEENIASNIDMLPNYGFHFGSGLSISYYYPGWELEYICMIDNTCYYLPEALGRYLDVMISDYENSVMSS